MIRIGLTGGIGAGKSTVARELAARGAVIVDGDKIAREVVEPGTPGLAALVEAFGERILSADGTLDRPALAAIAFADDESRATLNAITHPLVGARSQQLIAAAGPEATVVQDIPLLVENHLGPMFHLVLVVWAPAEERVHRLVTQRGMPEADARARIAAQATDEQRRAAADVWLDNSGAPDSIGSDVRSLWAERIAPFGANITAGRPAVDAPPPADPAAASARLVGRLWVALGSDAAQVDVGDLSEAASAVVTPAPGIGAEAVAERLAPAAFYPVGPGVLAGADPAAASRVTVAS